MKVSIIRTGLRPVRDGMILWASDRLREIDRDLYTVNCRVADMELQVRGKFYEFDQNLNREVPDHILIDRLRRFMSRYDQETFDSRREGYYYHDSEYYDDYDNYNGKTISREISRGISQGISDAFTNLGERVNEFVKEQEKASTPTTQAPAPPAPTPVPAAPAAATQSDVAALQAQLAALQQQLADLQKKGAATGGGTK